MGLDVGVMYFVTRGWLVVLGACRKCRPRSGGDGFSSDVSDAPAASGHEVYAGWWEWLGWSCR